MSGQLGSTEPARHGSAAEAGPRLLIVHGEAATRDALVRGLAYETYGIVETASGRAALDYVAAEPFDLILLDMAPPDVDGLQLLTLLTADSRLCHIPVIMIATLDDSEGVASCLGAGAEDYLSKPYHPFLLRARVDAALEKKRLRDSEKALHEALAASRLAHENLLQETMARAKLEIVQLQETVKSLRRQLDSTTSAAKASIDVARSSAAAELRQLRATAGSCASSSTRQRPGRAGRRGRLRIERHRNGGYRNGGRGWQAMVGEQQPQPGTAPGRSRAAPRPASRTQPPRASIAGLQTQLHRYEVLLNVAQRVWRKETLADVLTALVELTSQELHCERSSYFLNDPEAGELYAPAAQGLARNEIRFLNTQGVDGAVFQSGAAAIVNDAYSDPRFSPEVDLELGFTTRNILVVPLRSADGSIFGVAQCLNKIDGDFTDQDRALLTDIAAQAIPALRSSQFIERMHVARGKEMEFVNVVAEISSHLDLDALLQRIMSEVTRMLDVERSTLFLNDEKTGELFSRLAQGDGIVELRLPNTRGIAGMVFSSGTALNIPYAYADLRFDPGLDDKTGFFTRSILCTPVVNKQRKVIGVMQTLNKKNGVFTDEDEQRLRAFTAQIAITLENAKLFDDVQKMKSYNESMLESMSNGVVTLDENEIIVTCNAAGRRILKIALDDVIGSRVEDVIARRNPWILDRIRKVATEKSVDVSMDVEFKLEDGVVSANLTVLPLQASDSKQLGTMLVFEDISSEKRAKATMARYMDPTIAARMLDNDSSSLLGGVSARATILFSDIRGFTSLTEKLGAQGTVAFLNEYFTLMVDCIAGEEGMLDKFIGDAIMAAFGLPLSHADDEDRAVRASIAMIRECRNWSEQRAQRGQPRVDMGIGLNTDSVVSGNIGSAKRMDYTLIGDGVNLASRLESACKTYSARILISENTYANLHGTYRIRGIDQVVVKGQTKPVAIYEVLDYHTPDSFPAMMDVLGYFNEGIEHYRGAQFAKALDRFQKALDRHPRDALTATYIERCRHLVDHPPGDIWDGVWYMTEK
ncbi:MAG: GAF domain-containing protein [Pseudomonadota bacterium]